MTRWVAAVLLGAAIAVAPAAAGIGTGERRIGAEELPAMTLQRPALGPGYATFSFDFLQGGFMDNLELVNVGSFGEGPRATSLLRALGRATGYASSYERYGGVSDYSRIETAVHVFRDERGASRFLDEVVAESRRRRGTTFTVRGLGARAVGLRTPITLFRTAWGAAGYLADSVDDDRRQAGTRIDDEVVERVDTFDVSGIADDAAGVRIVTSGRELTIVVVRRGRALGRVFLWRTDRRDARAEAVRLARTLDERVERVLGPAVSR